MPTLTNDSLVTQYVATCKLQAFKNWNTMTKNQRGTAIVNAAAMALLTCGVPKPTANVSVLAAGYQGLFDFQTWSLKMSVGLFDGDMDYNNIHPYFVNTLETVYHEARHCEQWWNMARFHALGRQPADVARELGIPMAIATRACQKPMKSSRAGHDPMLNLTKGWYESVYGSHGGLQRGITLGALALKRTQQVGRLVPIDQFHRHRYAEYKENLPEEVDAWAIQDLVRAKF